MGSTGVLGRVVVGMVVRDVVGAVIINGPSYTGCIRLTGKEDI